MADITAQMVKELRDATGAGMMECKHALEEANADFEKAVDVLRKKGLAAAAKKAGRSTNEGTIMTVVSEDKKSAAILELNCETDFVGTNEKFQAYAKRVANAALVNKPKDVDALKASKDGDETVEEIVTDCIHILGENTQIARFEVREAGLIVSYIHTGGRIGVLAEFEVDGIDVNNAEFIECAEDVAMQVCSMTPISATRDDVPQDVVEHEKEIYKAQAAESGKPEEIQEKMAEGRLNKFYKEQCLTEQEFWKESNVSVQKYVDGVASKLGGTIKITGFVRYELGE